MILVDRVGNGVVQGDRLEDAAVVQESDVFREFQL